VRICEYLRIQKFHALVHPSLVADKVALKKDAWMAKGFCVLLKRKLSRQTKSRTEGFRRLMNLLDQGS
jgi:hypothetical protein